MKVIMGDKVYEATRQQADGMIETAGQIMKSGIYAVEKDGIVELKNEKIIGYSQIRKVVREYREKGFKVHYNS